MSILKQKPLTVKVGGEYVGAWPNPYINDPGPRRYILARFSNYLARNWTADVGGLIQQSGVQPSPANFEYVATPETAHNVKVHPHNPGGFKIQKGYLANPTPGNS